MRICTIRNVHSSAFVTRYYYFYISLKIVLQNSVIQQNMYNCYERNATLFSFYFEKYVLNYGRYTAFIYYENVIYVRKFNFKLRIII